MPQGSFYDSFTNQQNRGPKPFTPFGQANLPQLANSGINQQQPVNVADLWQQTMETGMQNLPSSPKVLGHGARGTSGGGLDLSGILPWASAGGFVAGQALNLLNPPEIDYNVPGSIPGLDDMRRNLALQNQGVLNQELEQLRRFTARTGLDNSGYQASLQNPAFQGFGERGIAGEAAISQAEMNAWLQLENLKLEKAIQEFQGQGGFGDLLSGAASLLPFIGG